MPLYGVSVCGVPAGRGLLSPGTYPAIRYIKTARSLSLVSMERTTTVGGLFLVKILIVATLLLGTTVLAANFVSSHPRPSWRRNLLDTLRRPGSTVSAMLGEAQETARRAPSADGEPTPPDRRVRRTEAEWKSLLTPEQYRVAREGRTERPFEGRFWDHHEPGTYHCVACAQALFSSEAKLASDNGWPNFSRPLTEETVDRITDISYGKIRTELVCARCESHLGHLFADGHGSGRRRYCVNSSALAFVASAPGDRSDKTG